MRSPSRQQFLLINILAVFAHPNDGVTLATTTATAVAFLPLHHRQRTIRHRHHHQYRDKCAGNTAKQLRLSTSLQSTGKANEEDNMKDDQRRKVILGGAGMASAAAFLSPPIFSPSSRIKSAFAATMNDNEPIADLPMRRLQLPKGGMGREYVIIQLYIQGKGPYDFMVDSGLTTELITPREFCFLLCVLVIERILA